MRETRHQFREDLKATEQQVLDGLGIVTEQLDRALEAVVRRDVELAQLVVAEDERVDERYLEVQHGILSLLARQAPVAGDLRIIAALLHVVRCMERMGDQCVNIATLVPLSGHDTPNDTRLLDTLEKMGRLAQSQLVQARQALVSRDLAITRSLVAGDCEINQLNRAIFRRAVEIGDEAELREWGMYMILVARCLERIGDNAVDIAEQIIFVATGLFQEMDAIPSGLG